jgi:hypothetical protein
MNLSWPSLQFCTSAVLSPSRPHLTDTHHWPDGFSISLCRCNTTATISWLTAIMACPDGEIKIEAVVAVDHPADAMPWAPLAYGTKGFIVPIVTQNVGQVCYCFLDTPPPIQHPLNQV